MRGKQLFVPQGIDGNELARRLELDSGAPVLVLLGGAANLPTETANRVEGLVVRGIARAASELSATVIDGGTDVGVMRVLDAGLAAARHDGAYVAVAPSTKLSGVNSNQESRWPMGEHHTHAVLVEGDDFGDETHTMYELVEALSQDSPSLAILIDGGAIAQQELAFNIRQGREVLVIGGTGRLADEVTDATQQEHSDLGKIMRSGRFTEFEITETPEDLAHLIRTKLEDT